jgi:hypothetical protein
LAAPSRFPANGKFGNEPRLKWRGFFLYWEKAETIRPQRHKPDFAPAEPEKSKKETRRRRLGPLGAAFFRARTCTVYAGMKNFFGQKNKISG